MGYIYKLVDKKGKELAEKGEISLSQPILEFRGSEGKFINFAKRVYKKIESYDKKELRLNEEQLLEKIKPTQKNLTEIKEWMDIYVGTYKKYCEDKAIYDDYSSDASIMFCRIMHSFCGYFTEINLLDSKKLIEFLKKFNGKGDDKVAVIRLNDSIFNKQRWRTTDLYKPFEPCNKDYDDINEYNGTSHLINITYLEKYDDYKELMTRFNGYDDRHARVWFNYLSKEFEWQKEKRIFFSLESFKINERTSAYTGPLIRRGHFAYENKIFNILCGTLIYHRKNCPKYLTLNVGSKNIKIYSIEDIKNGKVKSDNA